LEINRKTGVEPVHNLSDGIASMAIKNVEIGDSFFTKEWTSYAAMESDFRGSVDQL
jgi:hypothetical protein